MLHFQCDSRIFKHYLPKFFFSKSKVTYITIWKGTHKFKMFKSDVCLAFKINHSISLPSHHDPQRSGNGFTWWSFNRWLLLLRTKININIVWSVAGSFTELSQSLSLPNYSFHFTPFYLPINKNCNNGNIVWSAVQWYN